jgi:hypothetical protein
VLLLITDADTSALLQGLSAIGGFLLGFWLGVKLLM